MEELPVRTGRNGGTIDPTRKKVRKTVRYKVVEVSVVTEDAMEEQLNKWSGQGWHFESIHFVVRENSRRPSMAFIFFAKDREESSE